MQDHRREKRYIVRVDRISVSLSCGHEPEKNGDGVAEGGRHEREEYECCRCLQIREAQMGNKSNSPAEWLCLAPRLSVLIWLASALEAPLSIGRTGYRPIACCAPCQGGNSQGDSTIAADAVVATGPAAGLGVAGAAGAVGIADFGSAAV